MLSVSTMTGKNLTKTAALTAICVSVALSGCQNTTALSKPSAPVTAKITTTQTSYQDSRFLTINGQNQPVSETSARIVFDKQTLAPQLVADIFDGKGAKAVAGYKVMLINRTSSIAAEGRKMDNGTIIDNRMIHRGSKVLVGIPVVNGQANLAQAQVLNFDIIYDDPSKMLAQGETFKPRGNKMTKQGVPVTNQKVTIRSLTLPNSASGESAGGGVDFDASALVDGKLVRTGANSAFHNFYSVVEDNARGF